MTNVRLSRAPHGRTLPSCRPGRGGEGPGGVQKQRNVSPALETLIPALSWHLDVFPTRLVIASSIVCG